MTRAFYPVSRGVLACAAALSVATALASGAHATVIYNATGGAPQYEGADVADPNAPGGVGVGPLLADRFLSPVAERLTSVTLNLKLDGPALNGFTVDLWRDSTTDPGLPVGPEIQIALVKDSSLTPNLALYTFTPLSDVMLAANTFYDVGIDTGTFANQVTNAALGNTVDPAVLARPSVMTGALYFHTVGGIDPNSDGPYDVIVNATAPEASTWAMMLLGFASLGFVGYQKRRTRIAPPVAD
jgi:hypothetical protein